MIKAVLLDLDNTLLRNPDAQWVAVFRAQWDRYFARRYGIEGASDALRAAIGYLNSEPPTYRTNADLMLDGLCGETPLSKDKLSAAIGGFYREDYAGLRATTSPMPGAAELVQTLLDQNLMVAIATNPFFPQSATEARIGWAGLGELLPEFAFVTHSENMRFTKPSRAYFAETVAAWASSPTKP